MVKQCLICKKLDILNPDLSFHKFPSDNERRNLWHSLLKLTSAQTRKYSYVCSDHFNVCDIVVRENGARCLKTDALPKPLQQEIFLQPLNLSPSTSSGSELSIASILQNSPESEKSRTSSFQSIGIHKTESSTTLTASESERQILNADGGKNVAGTSSDFRGTLALVSSSKKRKRSYVGDLTSDDFSSPRQSKQNYRKMKTIIFSQRKKIKLLHNKVRRLRARINSMQNLILMLKEKSLITSESSAVAIRASISGHATEIFNRMLKGPSSQKYSPSLRTFALTLSFYSPRAYNYVRNTFNRSLPHLSTISNWFRSVDGSPGFTQEALNALKVKTTFMKEQGREVLCNLVLDEMSIRKQIEWTGKQFTGYIDIGTGLNSDNIPEAREVLVFMLVAINDSWKIPLGYFLIDGLEGREKANLVRRCLKFINESGVTVTSLTFDGPPVNFSMAEELGCNFANETDLKTYFDHPTTKEKIFIYLDPSHMIKLIRNCFGTQKALNDGKGGIIDWEFIEKLFYHQNSEGLHAATKLKLRHLEWTREKMKVCLATQTISKSVSDALLYLCHDLQLSDFKNVDATSDFLLKFNNLFDIFNSHSTVAKYKFKKALSPETHNFIFKYLEEITEYILNLNSGGVPILQSQRKTGFLGFLININSLKEMYQTFHTNKNILSSFPTHRISQDHLESFFGAIRSKNGFNNNPTARQFQAAYKRLIVHTEISGPDTGNVLLFENVPILACGRITYNENFEDLQNDREYVELQDSIEKDLEEMTLNCSAWNLTDYVEDIVTYISGYVVKSLKKCISCSKCASLLESETIYSALQKRKQFGRLINASKLIIDICTMAEKYFRIFLKSNKILNIKRLTDNLIITVMKNMPANIFDHFGDHLYETSVIDSHQSQLLKLCLKNYFNIRIHYEVKKHVDFSKKSRVRSLNTKLILFKNQ